MFEIGDTLREARIRQGLSLKDAEDATKIRSKYLQALEHDDFSVIPGPTFVKGFLRTYAAFLGLDAGTIVDEYRSRHEPEQELHPFLRPSSNVRERPPRTGTLVVALLAVAVLLVLAWVGWGDRREEPAEIQSGNVVSVSTTITATETTVAPAAGGAATTTSKAAAKQIEFMIQAVRDRCWVVVRDGSAEGKVLYSGTLEEDDSVTYAVPKAAWITIGNPSAVRLVMNGKTIPVPDTYGNFLLSSSGLERQP